MVCAAHKTQQRPRPAAAGGPGPQPLAAALALLMAVAVLPQAAAVKPVGDGAWVQGLATHFGGAQDCERLRCPLLLLPVVLPGPLGRGGSAPAWPTIT